MSWAMPARCAACDATWSACRACAASNGLPVADICPELVPSPRSIRSFSSVIRASRAFSSVEMIVPIWSICLVNEVSDFTAAAEDASPWALTNSFAACRAAFSAWSDACCA
jgi:hypothetical protein